MSSNLFQEIQDEEMMELNGGLVILGVTITAVFVGKVVAAAAVAYGAGYAVGKGVAHATSK